MQVAVVAGATTGSTAWLIGANSENQFAEVRGPGITPLESNPERVYYGIRELCDQLQTRFARKTGIRSQACCLTFALSSICPPQVMDNLHQAARDSQLGPFKTEQILWMPRALACRYAAGVGGNSVVLKIGTVAFAHAFPRTDNTGSIRVGGWGLLSGYDGGAYSIGCEALARLFQELDGRKQQTAFSEQFFIRGNTVSIENLVTWLRSQYHQQLLRTEVSRLAITVTFLADRGLPVAEKILDRAARRCGESFVTAIKRVRKKNDANFAKDKLSVILHGGVVQNSQPFMERLLSECRNQAASAAVETRELSFQPTKYAPIVGALLYTLRQLGQHDYDHLIHSVSTSPELTHSSTYKVKFSQEKYE